ncbi:MAG TPA: flagellar type III secretion system protein FlhB [Acetobacteraceae bacterium]|nr:flagellar type III secretion system protein FlhB [Acetobacteraceae bacterium]
MAEGADRTEAATPRRLERARAAGQVPLSREATGLAVLGSAILVLVNALPDALGTSAHTLAALLEHLHDRGRGEAVGLALRAGLGIIAPFALAALVAGAAATLLQTGFLITPSAVLPDFSRLDPRRGLSRIGGPGVLLETGKSLLKMVIVGLAGWSVVSRVLPALAGAVLWDPGRLLHETSRQIVALLAAMLAAQAAIVAFDVLRARLQHARGLRMSRQELREEQRDSDGDPHVKARRRTIQRQRARRRMLSAVPKAAVVVTNPTHYAVALAYERGGSAPRVVAKGVDELAARIREIAAANRIPLVANPPLARALHLVELDTEIPVEHYKAVAEIIAYVWGLRGRQRKRAA